MSVLIILHIMSIILILILKKKNKLHISPAAIVIAALVPVFGLLCIISMEVSRRNDCKIQELADLNQMKIEDEIYRSIHVTPDDSARALVPVEESLLLNSAARRRRLLLNVLSLDTSEYVSCLRKAGQNEDTEVVHYAVTGLVELRKDFSGRLEETKIRMEQNPQDPEALREYIKLQERYIRSGLPENNELRESLHQYDDLLSKAYDDSKSAEERFELLKKRTECAMELKDYEKAGTLTDRLILLGPEREEGYLLKVGCCGALRDRKELDKVLQMIAGNHVFLSEKGRKMIAFWQPDGV